MKIRQHPFPARIAKAQSFCNRVNERAELKQRILQNEHTVLVAPRRYGKTSLIGHVLAENEFPSINIDLFLANSTTFIKNAIHEGVTQLLEQLLPKQQAAQKKFIEIIREMHPKLSINVLGQKLEISSSLPKERSIVELLLSAEEAAKHNNKKAVIVLDEFQQISEIKDSLPVEAAIRHAAERSEYVSYVFSGSHRHLLTQMFSDKSRPLYHLCELMHLNRIKKEEYELFLSKHFKIRWDKTMDPFAVDEILSLTACHAFYVNALCRKLWMKDEIPDIPSIQVAWSEYVESQSPWIKDDLDKLSTNQVSILAALAYNPTQEPLGNNFTKMVELSASSIKAGIDYLLKKDYIHQDEKHFYHVLDPTIALYLREIKYFDFSSREN